MYIIPKISPEEFDWLRWTGGSIADLGVPCREICITSAPGYNILRRHVVGYCPGEYLFCRPKINEVAVMCVKDDREFWFHLQRKEFDAVFSIQYQSSQKAR